MLLYILIFFIFLFFYKKEKSFSRSFIKSLITISLYCLISTEFLSFFNLINKSSIIILDLFVITIIAIFFIDIKTIRHLNKITERRYYLLGIIFIPLLFLALFYSPNNWDSMTYHLPRIEHWLRNGNVNYYPTQNIRQIFHQPLSEYILLHSKFLSINDSFYNLIQFFFFIGILCLVHQIIGYYSNNSNIKFLGVVSVSSTPIFLLESSTTQNDIVATFFFLSILNFLINIYRTASFQYFLFFFLSFFLGFLIKASVIIFALPFLLIYGVLILKHHSIACVYKKILIGCLLSVLTLPYFYRNHSLTGSLMGDKKIELMMRNDSYKLKNCLVNSIRNYAMNLSLPNEKMNQSLNQIVEKSQLMITKKINDKENTFGPKFDSVFRINEDLASQSILFITFTITFIFFVINYKKYNFQILFFVVGLVLSFLFFSLIFKWQPWGVRLLMPLYVLMWIFIVLILEKIINSKLALLLSLALIIQSLPYLFLNENKPISKVFKSHEDKYFLFTEDLKLFGKNDFSTISKKIANLDIKNIGLILNNDTWEYPIWALSNNDFNFDYICFDSYLTKLKNNKDHLISAIIMDKNSTFSIKNIDFKDSIKSKYLDLFILKKPVLKSKMITFVN